MERNLSLDPLDPATENIFTSWDDVAAQLGLTPGSLASILTTNGDIITRTAGVPARITRTSLADDPAFTSRFNPKLTIARAVRTSSDITVNSTTWIDLDTGLDLTLAAIAGDRVQVGMSGFTSNEAVVLYLDVVSLVSGSPVNSWGADAAPNNAYSGVGAWLTFATNDRKIGGQTDPRPVVSGDLSGGNLTLRFRTRTFSAANRIVTCSANSPLRVWAINYGQ